MPKQTFTLWSNEVVTAASLGITENGSYEMVSGEINNSQSALRSLQLVLDYSSVLPPEDVNGAAQPIGFLIDAVVEGRSDDGAQWFPLAYQFSTFNRPSRGPKRIIHLQPSIVVIDLGVDDIVFAGNATQARISRQQGSCPDTAIRCKLLVTETDYGGPGAFQSMTLNVYGELFDV